MLLWAPSELLSYSPWKQITFVCRRVTFLKKVVQIKILVLFFPSFWFYAKAMQCQRYFSRSCSGVGTAVGAKLVGLTFAPETSHQQRATSLVVPHLGLSQCTAVSLPWVLGEKWKVEMAHPLL